MTTTTRVPVTELHDGDLLVLGGDALTRVARIEMRRGQVRIYQYAASGRVLPEPVVTWRADRIVRIGAGSARFHRSSPPSGRAPDTA